LFFRDSVPIKTLFDCLAHGDTLDDFLDGFEGVDREQAEAAIALAAEDCSMAWGGCEAAVRS